MNENRPAEHKRAFISHSSPDDRYVQELVQFVRKLGYPEVFNDSHTIEPDEKFWPRIERGIRECDAFVVVLSHSSVQSYWVNQEVQFARTIGKPVIPIRIDDCKLPASFDGRDVIELRQGRGDKVKIATMRILRHSPAILFGREKWLEALDAAWADQHLNLYTLVAWGGVGKTSLVAHWVGERLMKHGWPGVERYFDWSFYSQGTGESRQTSADLFISDALKFFGDPDPTLGSPWERGERLAITRQHRTLLVLDGIEPLQYPPTDKSGQAGRLKDPGLEALVQSLAADNPGLCIITTREHLKNVESLPTTEEKKLDHLPKGAAIALLRHLQIAGTDEELEAAWKDAGGHALTLQLLGHFIADAYPHDRDIRHYKQVKFAEADQERHGRSAFKVMIAYEKWLALAGAERQRELALLRLTGLFDRPISADCLKALRAEPAIPGLTDALVKLKETHWNVALERLIDIDLLSRSGSGTDVAIDAHPLVREYFAERLQRLSPDAFRAAHSRLFDHLCETTPYRPDDLQGLQPLYQAVVHGCLAGRQSEANHNVYDDRILRGTSYAGFFSLQLLGAVSADLEALAAFFDEPWSRLSSNLSAREQSWVLNETARRLRALGRVNEAVEATVSSLKHLEAAEEWRSAMQAACNLSEMKVLLGLLSEAFADAGRAIEFAEKNLNELEGFVISQTTAADALFQAGRWADAEALYARVERIQTEHLPSFPFLYSLQGFQYNELLLANAERLAWQAILSGVCTQPTTIKLPENERTSVVRACREVRRRAWTNSRVHWAQGLHDRALDDLTFGRASLFHSLVLAASMSVVAKLQSEIATSIARFREGNRKDSLPLALLTAAFCAGTLAGQTDEARRYLAEAQQIAERGPMPLYLADVHLHRARLFRNKAELAKARTLIEKHGYWRRKDELEDAEAAL